MDFPLDLRERRNMAHLVDGEVLSALQIRGQDLFRQKQYEAALQCFTESIDRDAKAPISILDNRAATYTKLGNLRDALKDGRQMIQREKENCSGYLRTGKILQLKGHHKMALDLYEMGTRKVPSSDPNVVLLRAQQERLARQLAPPKAVDPLQMLPLELAEMMISYLEFRHIVGLLRVSKTWSQLITSMPGLWSDLDFSTAKKPVTLGAIRKYIEQGNGTTSRVILDRFGSSAGKIPRYIATRCRWLKDLRISGGLIGASIVEAVPCISSLKTLIVSGACQISCDVASQLLSRSLNLERAEFEIAIQVKYRPVSWKVDMPKLRTLKLDTSHPQNYFALPTLIDRIPNIHTLSVQGWIVVNWSTPQVIDFSKLHQLQDLDISRITMDTPLNFPPTLRSFLLTKCLILFPGINFAVLNLPHMMRLSLAEWDKLSLSELQTWLIPNKGKLTYLDIGGCVSLSNANIKEIITQNYLEGIEELVLKSCNIDDEIAILMASNLPRLRKLNVANSKITGVGVKALLVGLKGKLQHLCLDGCYSTNIDAVNLARGMGVKVAYGFPDKLKGGRRIRHY